MWRKAKNYWKEGLRIEVTSPNVPDMGTEHLDGVKWCLTFSQVGMHGFGV